jgi:hypothetical protein
VTVTLTVVVAPEAVAPTGLPLTKKLCGPVVTEAATLIVKTLVAPAKVGVTGLTVKDPQVTPVGSPEHDKVTDCAVPAFRVAVIVTVPELP